MFKSSLCLLGRNTEAVAKLNVMLGMAAQGGLVGADTHCMSSSALQDGGSPPSSPLPPVLYILIIKVGCFLFFKRD